jgi:pyruvate-ferredoxin/flavodoxin oxidoreductase
MSNWHTVDGNEAVASVAYRASEVIGIYPITPASPMGELADAWAVEGRTNLWRQVPDVIEMQSEAGAIGAVHGALQAGALSTTFTASQGLLLMLPNLYKIAGELTPFCMHVAARTVATHALSIFGDHSDVMACRPTGVALLASSSVQQAHDLAAVAHAATLSARVPLIHFFDGFRTSHEINRIAMLSDDELASMFDVDALAAHRARALTPDRPVVRGTSQNPDVFFQAREAANAFYDAVPGIVERTLERIAGLTGRRYGLFDYAGHPEAERVIVLMGSGAETAIETAQALMARGERVGVVTVHLYRPFSIPHFVSTLPSTVRAIAVLDRTKEPGAPAEPLHLDVVSAIEVAASGGVDGWPSLRARPGIRGGRYGLGGKEFTPAMVKAVFDALGRDEGPRQFTVGIVDDVTRLSLEVDPDFDLESDDTTRAVFFGLGADGTVGANKNSIKIIGEHSPLWPQGYFVYDSKKSGATTVSHLRFGPRPIRAPHLVSRASFVACHQFDFLDRLDVIDAAAPGATLLLNAPYAADRVWDELPVEVQQAIIDKRLEVHAVDAYRVAREAGLGRRINTVMQACFFALTGVLPMDEALAHIEGAIAATYGKAGEEVVARNVAAVRQAHAHLARVSVPDRVTTNRRRPPAVSAAAPDFVQRVTAVMLAGRGDLLPVSAFPVDGTWPLGTARWEKRNIAAEVPAWDADLCIQCNKCVLVCPHAVIRAKTFDRDALAGAPPGFASTAFRAHEAGDRQYALQVAVEDCTGCSLCVVVCPAKDKANPKRKALEMVPQRPLRETERANHEFFLSLPDVDRTTVKLDVKGSQFLTPLFEFSGACAGCGETPYVKLLTQLFGDRLLIANATGCSSIYGGNLPTTPYTTDANGRGPAWANSLFEDNAEFGLGFRLAVDAHEAHARHLLRELAQAVDSGLAEQILDAAQETEADVAAQRARVARLAGALTRLERPEAARLAALADYLVRKSVWIVGGDGWAYDIGFGGVDHVLASGRNVNILVLDTEVYSNTGGQQSKATPLGASAKFAVAGKTVPKKDLGLEAMTYGHAYVASIAFGAKDTHTVKALTEADGYPGPSLVLAYSPCIAHGYDLAYGADHQRQAVECGHWPLFHFDPRRLARGEHPLELDAKAPKARLLDYLRTETRFRLVERQDPERFRALVAGAEREAEVRRAMYEHLASFRAAPPRDARH